jgi:hypothetical protein
MRTLPAALRYLMASTTLGSKLPSERKMEGRENAFNFGEIAIGYSVMEGSRRLVRAGMVELRFGTLG